MAVIELDDLNIQLNVIHNRGFVLTLNKMGFEIPNVLFLYSSIFLMFSGRLFVGLLTPVIY